MGILASVLHKLRVWAGLADASESHLTPSHGWLLTAPIEMGRRQHDVGVRPVARGPFDKSSRP